MAVKYFLSDINLNGNQLKSVVAEQVTSVASITNPAAGRFVYDLSDNKFKYYNGTAWIAGAEYAAATKKADDAANKTYQIYDSTTGNTFQFRAIAVSGKLGISSADGVITISLDSTAFDQEIADAIEAALAADGNVAEAIADAVADVKGTAEDAASAETIAGAKAYADEKAAAVEAKLPVVAQGAGIVVTPSTDETTGKITYTVSADASIFEYKGEVASVDQLPSDAEVGNVYQVAEDGLLYAWNGSEWNSLGHADGVTDVDTTASAGVQLTKSADGKVGVNVTPGEVAEGNTSVVTGGAVAAADAQVLSDAKAYADAIKVNGQSQVDQEITIDGADIKLDGYAKGTDKSQVAETDTINQAIAKLENRIGQSEASGTLTYTTTVAAGSTSPQSISKSAHGCGSYPMVQAFLGGELVEVAVAINNGDVTISWNGSLSAELRIVIVGNPNIN